MGRRDWLFPVLLVLCVLVAAIYGGLSAVSDRISELEGRLERVEYMPIDMDLACQEGETCTVPRMHMRDFIVRLDRDVKDMRGVSNSLARDIAGLVSAQRRSGPRHRDGKARLVVHELRKRNA